MTVVALQNELIHQISEIGDVHLLQSIKDTLSLLKSKSKLSDFQLNRIRESEIQISKGESIEQEQLIIKMQQWLKAQ
jgi:hypothetical protein